MFHVFLPSVAALPASLALVAHIPIYPTAPLSLCRGLPRALVSWCVWRRVDLSLGGLGGAEGWSTNMSIFGSSKRVPLCSFHQGRLIRGCFGAALGLALGFNTDEKEKVLRIYGMERDRGGMGAARRASANQNVAGLFVRRLKREVLYHVLFTPPMSLKREVHTRQR